MPKGDTAAGCIPFRLACEKIVLFLTFLSETFSRMSWRRCLTPVRAEFSRQAGERFGEKRLETAGF